jgi:hypothetical protein
VDRIIGFEELRWLQELAAKLRAKHVPAVIGTMLLARGLVERKDHGLVITARGRIALAKLG